LARRILLADDSVTAQNMGRRILTDAGYEVVTVNNGSAALKKIAENKPDLIVLDVYMPGYGGLEVCQRVKENPETKQIPVLLTVGKLEPFKAEEARRVGADSFIIKPFEATELLTVLTKLEDKIVAQPQPQKSGRFAKALAAVEQSDKGDRFGDKETGWKNRLTIPVPHAKPAASEEVPEAAATRAGSDFRGAEQTEAVAPVVAEGFERPIPAGLPADITPEEIAAITAAAAAFGGKVEQSPAISEPRGEDAVASQQVASPAAAPAQSAEAETPSVVQALAPEVTQQAQAAVPAEAAPETIASAETVRPQDHQVPDVPIAENQLVESQVVDNQVSQSQIAESHVAENLIQAGQTEQQPVSADQPVATNSEASAEAQISPAPTAAGDAELMAAIASLSPSNGSNGTGYEAPAAAYSSTAFSEVASGPRWIAEPVDLALEESKLALDQEMDLVHAARATADAVSLSAATALANSSTVAVAEPVEPAIAAQANVTKSATTTELTSPVIAAEANVVESGISQPSVSQPGVTEPKTNESTTAEASTAYDQTPLAAQASAYAAAASAGAGSEYAAPVEVVSATTSAPENRAIHQAESAPQREAELAAAWQNWKQIRESFAGSQPASAAADARANEAPANEAPVESHSKQEEAAVSAQSTSADAVAEPVDAGEEASDAPEESTVIASMVDNMLAELRPKLVAEIAKKMNSEKKEKEKKKKK
jgi:twitching motility two-component system response regulator PilH